MASERRHSDRDAIGRAPIARNASRVSPPWPLGAPLISPLARLGAHVLALPLRALARSRVPAVADPGALSPGDIPPTDGRLLLLFDGGCGICLHARDTLAFWDRGGRRLAFDRIARHDAGLLRGIPAEERYGAWHVIHPDGRLESGAMGVASSVEALPGGALPARLARRFPGAADRGYKWFVHNRGWISRGSGLINHPQRDPREQLHDPRHLDVVPNPAP
ncbi:MAG: DCC1-like thiol-disulfide oxidoreductase family protein [Patulibacter minatonensis]